MPPSAFAAYARDMMMPSFLFCCRTCSEERATQTPPMYTLSIVIPTSGTRYAASSVSVSVLFPVCLPLLQGLPFSPPLCFPLAFSLPFVLPFGVPMSIWLPFGFLFALAVSSTIGGKVENTVCLLFIFRFRAQNTAFWLQNRKINSKHTVFSTFS